MTLLKGLADSDKSGSKPGALHSHGMIGGSGGGGGGWGDVAGPSASSTLVDDSALVLTPLGQHLARLPVDVRLGKMLVLGAMFGCLDPVTTAVAVLSTKSPFVSAVERRTEVDNAKKVFLAPQVSRCNT